MKEDGEPGLGALSGFLYNMMLGPQGYLSCPLPQAKLHLDNSGGRGVDAKGSGKPINNEMTWSH